MTPPRDEPLEAADVDPADLAAVGDAIEAEVDLQVEEATEDDRSNRVARTAVQTSIPAALVGIFEWQAALHKIDLDPGAGIGLPGAVAGYFVSILTVVGAVLMNRRPR